MNNFEHFEIVFISHVNDTFIFGETEVQHDIAFRQVLYVTIKNNIKLNKTKLQFKVNTVKFYPMKDER